MKAILFAVILTVMAFAAGMPQSQTVQITNFQPGKTAITEDIEQQLILKVVAPLRLKLEQSQTNNVRIEFHVHGFADQSGNRVQNDDLGRKRAENVGGSLGEKFPGATVDVISNGDEKNVRMVTVSWSLVQESVPQRSRASISTAIASLLMLVAGLLLLRASRKTEQKHLDNVKKEIKETIVKMKTPAPIVLREIRSTEEWVSATYEGVAYSVLIVPGKNQRGESGWNLPFLTQKEPKIPTWCRDRHGAIKTARNCLNNPYYSSEIQQGIAAGRIKIKKEI